MALPQRSCLAPVSIITSSGWHLDHAAFPLIVTDFVGMLGYNAQEQQKRYPDGLPQLDPVEDMNLHDEELDAAVRRIEVLEKRLCANEFFRVPSAFHAHLTQHVNNYKFSDICHPVDIWKDVCKI